VESMATVGFVIAPPSGSQRRQVGTCSSTTVRMAVPQVWLKNTAAAGLVSLMVAASGPGAVLAKGMRLPSKPPETNAQAILLQAVPVTSSSAKDAGLVLASITTEGGGNIRSSGGEVRASKGLKSWKYIQANTSKARDILNKETDLKSVDDGDRQIAQERLLDAKNALDKLRAAAEKQKSAEVVKNQIAALQALDEVASLNALHTAQPMPVPEEYSKLPRLFGHANVELQVSYKASSGADTTGTIVLEVDGFSAPVSAGHFVELVNRGKYDNLKFATDDEVLLETSKPAKESEPIPLEILVENQKAPEYGTTLEEAGMFNERPVLPFNAYGTLALSRPQDSGMSTGGQFFFVKTDAAETPAGLNLLDGNYSVFGYVIDGQGVLNDLHANDSIKSARVTGGAYKLEQSQ